MATCHRDADGEPWIFVKGAPERILEMCKAQPDHDGERPLDVDYWGRMATDTAAQGLRLLALASKRTAPDGERLGFADVEAGYTGGGDDRRRGQRCPGTEARRCRRGDGRPRPAMRLRAVTPCLQGQGRFEPPRFRRPLKRGLGRAGVPGAAGTRPPR